MVEGKELREALKCLEKCCPGSTQSLGFDVLTSSAELCEALLNLDCARKHEQRLKDESEALLEGMDIIISSENTKKAFNLILDVLKRLLDFDDAFVLLKKEDDCLAAVASSTPLFEDLVWQGSVMFSHVLAGNTVNLREISTSTDWQEQPAEIRRHVKSALHTPFHTTSGRAILTCVSNQEGFFNKTRIDLLKRFSPLAGHALHNLEINDRLRDEIRERKQAEERLAAAHASLEHKVRERTAELSDSNVKLQQEIHERKRAEIAKEKMFAQLLQSQKMESIGLLAGGIAHDFNNIITTILGRAELAMFQMSRDDPFRAQMEDIHEAGEMAASLTGQLLAFSRKQVFETKVVNLNTLISNMAKMLVRLIGRNIDLQLHLNEQTGNIKVDPSQVEQVLMNLVVNAKDAMPESGTLSILTENILFTEEEAAGISGMKPGAYAMLSVRDTGAGMSEEVQKEIFKPFFTTKVMGKGTGLGLATVYGIVKQHNSYIYVNSEPNRGTVFTIYFPVTEEDAPEHEIAASEAGTTRQATETVLVVDSDPSVRSLITNALTPKGYTCLNAANGQEALQIVLVAEKTIDLLLTDILMPDMNGPELATFFKKQFPGAKVIFMSGYLSDLDSSNIFSDQDAFLQKPLTPTKLLNKLEEVLAA